MFGFLVSYLYMHLWRWFDFVDSKNVTSFSKQHLKEYVASRHQQEHDIKKTRDNKTKTTLSKCACDIGHDGFSITLTMKLAHLSFLMYYPDTISDWIKKHNTKSSCSHLTLISHYKDTEYDVRAMLLLEECNSNNKNNGSSDTVNDDISESSSNNNKNEKKKKKNNKTKNLYLVVCGSQTSKDWFQINLDTDLQPHYTHEQDHSKYQTINNSNSKIEYTCINSSSPHGYQKLRIHKGMYRASLSLINVLRHHVKSIQDHIDHFYFTGHSSGGSIASILLTLLQDMNCPKCNRTSLYTFGSPFPGDKNLYRFINQHTHKNLWIINDDDPIPYAFNMCTGNSKYMSMRRLPCAVRYNTDDKCFYQSDQVSKPTLLNCICNPYMYKQYYDHCMYLGLNKHTAREYCLGEYS
jgi:hypothetical protein